MVCGLKGLVVKGGALHAETDRQTDRHSDISGSVGY